MNNLASVLRNMINIGSEQRPGAGGDRFKERIPKNILDPVNALYETSNKKNQEMGFWVEENDWGYNPYMKEPGDETSIPLGMSQFDPRWDKVVANVHTHPELRGHNVLPNELSDEDLGISAMLEGVRLPTSPANSREDLYDYAITPDFIIEYKGGDVIDRYDRMTGERIPNEADIIQAGYTGYDYDEGEELKRKKPYPLRLTPKGFYTGGL